jgi:hypothetical protein
MIVRARPFPRWFQYGLGTLLFLMCCVAGFFAGYRNGFYFGHDAKAETILYSKAYRVKDIVSASSDSGRAAKVLTSYIQAAVVPQSWRVNAGSGDIAYDPKAGVVVATNLQRVHDQLADLMEQLRRILEQDKAADIELVLAPATR